MGLQDFLESAAFGIIIKSQKNFVTRTPFKSLSDMKKINKFKEWEKYSLMLMKSSKEFNFMISDCGMDYKSIAISKNMENYESCFGFHFSN